MNSKVVKNKVKSPRKRGRKGGVGDILPGQFCFRLDGTTHLVQQRSRYSESRKKEVGEVRKLGACLRCQLLKKSYSEDAPCQPCLRAASQNHTSRCLLWMDCIRPSFEAFDVPRMFDIETRNISVLEFEAAVGFLSKAFFMSSCQILYVKSVHSGIDACILGTHPTSSTINVFASILGGHKSGVQQEETLWFPDIILLQLCRIFAFISVFLYTYVDLRDTAIRFSDSQAFLIHILGSITRRLDVSCRQRSLAQYDHDQMKCLFVMLGGLSLTISSPDVLRKYARESRQQEAYDALLRLIDHYLVYVGIQADIIPQAINSAFLQAIEAHHWEEKFNYKLALLPLDRQQEAETPRISDNTEAALDAREVNSPYAMRNEHTDIAQRDNYSTIFRDFISFTETTTERDEHGNKLHESSGNVSSSTFLTYIKTLASWRPVVDVYPAQSGEYQSLENEVDGGDNANYLTHRRVPNKSTMAVRIYQDHENASETRVFVPDGKGLRVAKEDDLRFCGMDGLAFRYEYGPKD